MMRSDGCKWLLQIVWWGIFYSNRNAVAAIIRSSKDVMTMHCTVNVTVHLFKINVTKGGYLPWVQSSKHVVKWFYRELDSPGNELFLYLISPENTNSWRMKKSVRWKAFSLSELVKAKENDVAFHILASSQAAIFSIDGSSTFLKRSSHCQAVLLQSVYELICKTLIFVRAVFVRFSLGVRVSTGD